MSPLGNPNKGTCLITTSLLRPNLKYSVIPKPDSLAAIANWIVDWILRNHYQEHGIIYCLSKKDTETLANAIKDASKRKIKVAVYHADVDDITRKNVHLGWRNGSIHLVVATIAFGLGINQPNVRYGM